MTALHKNAETQLIDFDMSGSYISFVSFTFRIFNKAFFVKGGTYRQIELSAGLLFIRFFRQV